MTRIFTADRYDDDNGVPPGAEFDRVDAVQPLPAPKWTSEGYLKSTAYAARPGIYVYRETQDDGSVKEVRELVPPETLNSKQNLDSLAMKPITLGHPPKMLDPSTVADYQVGSVGERGQVSEDGRTQYTIMVTDADALASVKRWDDDDETLGTSPGYRATIDATPGEHPEYGAYDRTQIGRENNHLALTTTPRGGAAVHFRMDGVPEPVEVHQNDAPEEGAEDTMELIDQLIEATGLAREDAQRLIDDGKVLIEKADAFDAIPEPDLDAEKVARVAERKERRDLDKVAVELELDKKDDVDIDSLDNTELKNEILAAAGAEDVKFDGADDDLVTNVRYAAFLAFRKDSADEGDDDDDEGVRFDSTPSNSNTSDLHTAWASRPKAK